MVSWWQALQRWRAQRSRERHAIPDELWAWMLAHYPFIAERSEADLFELRGLSAEFLACKEFHGAHSLTVTDQMARGHRCAGLPVLRLGLM
jgi:Mlc titration factor MtfA (ptsG expression regulator)